MTVEQASKLEKGDRILFSSDEHKTPFYIIQRGTFERLEGNYIHFSNGMTRRVERCDLFENLEKNLEEYLKSPV